MIGQARRVLAIAANDLRVEFADRAIWLMLFVLPLVFTAILGAGQGGGTPAWPCDSTARRLGGAGGGDRAARRSTCGRSTRRRRTGRCPARSRAS